MSARNSFTALAVAIGGLYGMAAQAAPEVINIPAPTGGISHHTASNFNVTGPGVVLNNSLNAGESRLAGHLGANPNFTTQEARAILIEVNRIGNPSRLDSALEVFGNRPHLVIANPNGINVDGFETINVQSLTLTTGTPVRGLGMLTIDNSAWAPIQILGRGQNTSGLDFFDVLASRIHVYGPIGDPARKHSTQIGLHANVASHGFTGRPSDGSNTRGYYDPIGPTAISAGSAGSMYGSHITIKAYGGNIGINLQGSITSERSIDISGSGQVRLAGALNEALAGTFRIKGGAVEIAQKTQVLAHDQIDVLAENDIVLDTGSRLRSLQNMIVLASQLGGITQRADSLVHASSNVSLTAKKDIKTSQGASIESRKHPGSAPFKSTILMNSQSGNVEHMGALVSEEGDVAILAAETVRITHPGTLYNLGGNTLVRARRVLNDGTISNGHRGGKISINATESIINNHFISAALGGHIELIVAGVEGKIINNALIEGRRDDNSPQTILLDATQQITFNGKSQTVAFDGDIAAKAKKILLDPKARLEADQGEVTLSADELHRPES